MPGNWRDILCALHYVKGTPPPPPPQPKLWRNRKQEKHEMCSQKREKSKFGLNFETTTKDSAFCNHQDNTDLNRTHNLSMPLTEKPIIQGGK